MMLLARGILPRANNIIKKAPSRDALAIAACWPHLKRLLIPNKKGASPECGENLMTLTNK
jgi:hypothetical protein